MKVYPEIVTVPDPEVLQENLVESKHHRLTRSVRSGTISRDLKPNAITRDQLNVSTKLYLCITSFVRGYKRIFETERGDMADAVRSNYAVYFLF